LDKPVTSRMHTREIAHARGFTTIIAFPRKSIANGGYGGIPYKITPVLELSSVEYYIRLIRFVVRKKYQYL